MFFGLFRSIKSPVLKLNPATYGAMRARDEEKNDGTDISIVIKLRIRVEITGNKAYHRTVHQ